MKNFMLITFLAFTALCHAQTNKPSIKTVITEKRIIITSGKTSDQDFDALINETVEQYKDRPGIQIIVKAPGHKTFNYKTKDALKPEPIAFRIISSNEKLGGNNNKLEPEPIKYVKEKNSLHTETQDSIKTKNIDK
ncbi:hypothetical protein R1T16_12985 [Flavobacterium sp. DG1-102-2]|uniref:hypothetical protein n=1 Tax=Flavobacterium sp. DG1-102-2 TaxID=3081663 RepID=UPI002949B15A|nr:hypothetical protein [Flavobacterium sp. DG1-102-2]MDV6169343.1 hypothetical protein [Flavobacterium sp. DG1-102-2]